MQVTTSIWIKNVILGVVSGLFLLTHSAIAADSVAADEFLRSKLNQVFETLKKTDLDQEAKSKEIVEIVSPMFDFQRMASLSLGREYWPSLSKENRERFTDLFVKNLKQFYLSKITTYTDETISYEPAVKDDNKSHITTYLISKGSKISILYKFYQTNGQWKIYDLEIQGVSIIRSHQAQFKEILRNGTFDDLLLEMEKKVGA